MPSKLAVPKSAARGRPRSESARRAVLEAARVLFEKGGYPATTIEAIAARSGVAKTTIYRWWPNRAALVVELLLKMAAVAAPPPSGRNPMRALRTEFHAVAQASTQAPGKMLLSLLGEALSDPEVQEALMKGLFDPRREASAQVIRQAQASGALRKDIPPLVAVDLFFGPLFYRTFIRQEPASETFVRQVFEYVQTGLAPPGVRKVSGKSARGGARRGGSRGRARRRPA